jgi:hypothetical protein
MAMLPIVCLLEGLEDLDGAIEQLGDGRNRSDYLSLTVVKSASA